MTQSYNLSQLANNLNSSGQVLLNTGISGATPVANGGTGATTAVGARANLDVAQAAFSVPSGGIIMWSGSIATIPTGWFLCNGSNGTPDLRNRFIVGASVDNAGVSNTTITGTNTKSGGSKDATLVSHTHTATVTDPGHTHVQTGETFSVSNLQIQGGAAAGLATQSTQSATTGISVSNGTTGNPATDANLVPYLALAYIMKS